MAGWLFSEAGEIVHGVRGPRDLRQERNIFENSSMMASL